LRRSRLGCRRERPWSQMQWKGADPDSANFHGVHCRKICRTSASQSRCINLGVVREFEAFGLIIDALKTGSVCATTYQPRNQNPTPNDAFDMAERARSAMDNAGFSKGETFELVLEPVSAVCVRPTWLGRQSRVIAWRLRPLTKAATSGMGHSRRFCDLA